VAGLGLLARLTDADDLAAQPPEAACDDVRGWASPITDPDLAALDDHRRLVDALEVGGHRRSFAWMSRQAASTALPISTDDRLAEVCWS
jgi:hypothetical protein